MRVHDVVQIGAAAMLAVVCGAGPVRAQTDTMAAKMRQAPRVEPVRARPLPAPDLVVAGVTFTPAKPTRGDRVFIHVDIKNQGLAPAVIPAGVTLWSASKPNGSGVGGASAGIPIAPGATVGAGIYLVERDELQPGTYAIRIKVDPGSACAESDETNNERVVNLTIAPPDAVDLVVTDMALEPAQVTTTTDFRVRVTVKNQGTATASFPAQSRILGGPDLNYQFAGQQPEVFAPGESRTYRLAKGNVQAGSFTWTTMVDPDHVVPETNENNNERSIQVQVQPPAAVTGPAPDLVVTGVTFTPANPTVADRVTIDVAIKNQGQGPAVVPSSATVWSASLPNGSGVGGTSAGAPIAAGVTFHGVMTLLQAGALPAGTYAVHVTVDPGNRCAESVETNNERVVNLTIH
jgi:hypothetical protein